MCGADTFSCMPFSNAGSQVPTVDLVEINSLREFSLHESFLQRVSRTHDPVIKRLKFFIINGWPEHIPSSLLPFSMLCEEYTVQSGIVYRGCRIVPPLSMRNTILQQMHTGHPGICRMLRLARQYVW